MHRVFLSIGSNIGDKEKNCYLAVEKLREKGLIINKISPLYITEPWGYKKQPDFANIVIEVFTTFQPLELLYLVKNIEKQMGRKDTFKYGPRIIDIDIIFFDDIVYESPELKIPHPKMQERYFVLRPLCDIDPEFVHPLIKKTVKELLEKL
ncbi:MAG: 2-amino-4-hydroxy-6-hydroxymethyldihydropteridine diphosphokinase [Thermodesulfovibrio sp.]|nr:2-amino-4-hydroxy-6-hydroxymethyldihydropteridine diphosphokinase [Thermodesulfovibrio sp.]